jgi:hypothetical protein
LDTEGGFHDFARSFVAMSAIQPSTVAVTRAGMLKCLLLLAATTVPWPADWDRIRGMMDSARSPELNRAEREGYAAGYYQGLIGGTQNGEGTRTEQSLRLLGKPDGWTRFQEADVVHYLDDDFLQFELKPLVRRVLFGQPFLTNAYGMHDDPIEPEKADGSFRIAFLGSSMDMGWGVQYQDTYVNIFQEWLKEHAGRLHLTSPRQFEVLNFAVAAYSPLQRLETLKRKVLRFRPDMVIYSATTLDLRLMEIHLCDLFRKRVNLKYDFVGDIVALAGVGNEDTCLDQDGELANKSRLKTKLRPYYWKLYDSTLGAIAAECRSRDVPLVVVIIPRVGKADSPAARAESVARLNAVAAHNGVTVLDLSASFDRFDPATLEIAAWDDHPNAKGHRRLFLSLARAVVENPALYDLLFPGSRVLR